MINNSAAVLPGLAIWALCACQTAHGASPAPLQGVVEYDDRAIGFELGGRVVEVAVERGQRVEVGARIARLDDGLERPQRGIRVAELAMAQAQLKLLHGGARREDLRASEAEIQALVTQEARLQKDVEREKRLRAVNAVPAAALDTLEAELQATRDRRRALDQRLLALRSGARSEELAAAEARVAGADAALAAADARLERYTLSSPVAGAVIDVHAKVGEVIAPGAPVITHADLEHPFVDVFVPQAQLAGVAVGRQGQVRVDASSAPVQGRVEYVFPRTEFTPRFLFSEGERPNLVVRVRVRVEDPQHALHQGVPAFVRLGPS